MIRDAFEAVVHWMHDSFLVPSGKTGKDFVLELARVYQAYADNFTLHIHSVALSYHLLCACVMQVLLLQKPHVRNKSKDHVHCLESRSS